MGFANIISFTLTRTYDTATVIYSHLTKQSNSLLKFMQVVRGWWGKRILVPVVCVLSSSALMPL